MQIIKVVKLCSNHIRKMEECNEGKSPCWTVWERVSKADSNNVGIIMDDLLQTLQIPALQTSHVSNSVVSF